MSLKRIDRFRWAWPCKAMLTSSFSSWILKTYRPSLLIVPKGVRPPEVGEELPCQVRFSTSHFDQVLGLE